MKVLLWGISLIVAGIGAPTGTAGEQDVAVETNVTYVEEE